MDLDLKMIRVKHGITQKEAASKIGISVDYVKKIESGKHNPSLKVLKKIADAFGSGSIDRILQTEAS